MPKLITTLACCADDAPNAERLLDLIYALNRRQPHGHLVLAFTGVHAEMQEKIGIAARLAFTNVHELKCDGVPGNDVSKAVRINYLFVQLSKFVEQRFRWPWLLIEPDSVPLKSDWLETLATAYEEQPRPYMGSLLKPVTPAGIKLVMARSGIYPANAYTELRGFCNEPPVPFEHEAAEFVVPRCHYAKALFQQTVFTGKSMAGIRPEAVLVHQDKTMWLAEKLIRDNSQDGTWLPPITPPAEPPVMPIIHLIDDPAHPGKGAPLTEKMLNLMIDGNPTLSSTARAALLATSVDAKPPSAQSEAKPRISRRMAREAK